MASFVLLMAVAAVGREKLDWREARVVQAQYQTSNSGAGVAAGGMAGNIATAEEEIDLDVGDAVLVVRRTVVRRALWHPDSGLPVLYAIEGKKVWVKPPGSAKPMQLKLAGRYPKREPSVQ